MHRVGLLLLICGMIYESVGLFLSVLDTLLNPAKATEPIVELPVRWIQGTMH